MIRGQEYVNMHLNLVSERLQEVESGETWNQDLVENLLDSYQELAGVDLNQVDAKVTIPKINEVNQKVTELCREHVFGGGKEETTLMDSVHTLQSHIDESEYGKTQREYKTVIEGLKTINEEDFEVTDEEATRSELTDKLDWAFNAVEMGFLTETEYEELKIEINQLLDRISPDNLDLLPEEVIGMIFASQLSPEDLAHMKLVSKKYLNIAREMIGKHPEMQKDHVKRKLIEQMVESETNRNTIMDYLTSWISKKPEELDLQAKAILDNTTLLSIDFRKTSPKILKKIREFCPNLTELNIRYSDDPKTRSDTLPIEFNWEEIGNMTQLTKLSVSGVILTEDSVKFLNNLENLTELSIQSARFYDSQKFFGTMNLPQLKTLRLSGCDCIDENVILNDQFLEDISKHTNIEQMYILCNNSQVTNKGLRHLTQMKKLKRLFLDLQGSHITKDGIDSIGQIKSLEFLNLYDLQLDEDPTRYQGLSELVKLTRLSLLDSSLNIDDIRSFSHFPSLRYLGVLSAELASDAEALFPDFPKLFKYDTTAGEHRVPR